MTRYILLCVAAMCGLAHAAHAQTGCTQLTQTQLLLSFSDNVATGAITPQTMRNFVCSVGLVVGITPITSGTNGRTEYDNNGVLGELPSLSTNTCSAGSFFTQLNSSGSLICTPLLSASNVFTAAQAVTPTTINASTCTGTYILTPTGTASNDYVITCAASATITLANPTVVTPGQTLNFRIKQPPTGSPALFAAIGLGTDWFFAGATLPTLSTASNAIDVITCRVMTVTEIDCFPVQLAFASP